MKATATIAGLVWLEMLRRKDFYVLLFLLGALLLTLLSVNVFGLDGMSGYLMETALLLAWVFSLVLAVSVAGRQLPAEEARGSVYALLAKPVRRSELVAGKWLGSWAVAVAATVCFYAVALAAVRLRGGRADLATLVQAFVLHAAALGLVTALALALSTRLSTGAAATLTYLAVAACFVVVPAVPQLVLDANRASALALEVLYYGTPHLEFFDLRRRVVHGWGPAPWGAVAGAVLYGLCWSGIFVGCAWLGYRRKYFKRGRA